MENEKLFTADVSPTLYLLDASGRRHPVVSPDRAAQAIHLSDALKALGGTDRGAEDVGIGSAEADPLLVYYASHSGRPSKSEIARAARVIAVSDVTLTGDEDSDEEGIRVAGTRAIVYPERRGLGAAVPFLVSRRIWFNRNRSVSSFPSFAHRYRAFLADINARLLEGEVSLPR